MDEIKTKLSPYTEDKYYQLLTYNGLDEYKLIPTGLKIVRGTEEFVIPNHKDEDACGIDLLEVLGIHVENEPREIDHIPGGNAMVDEFVETFSPFTHPTYYKLLSRDGLNGYKLIPTSLKILVRKQDTHTFKSEDEAKKILKRHMAYDGEDQFDEIYKKMFSENGWEGQKLEKSEDGELISHHYSDDGDILYDKEGILLFDIKQGSAGGKRKSRRNNKHKSRKARKMKTRKSRKTGRSRRRRR